MSEEHYSSVHYYSSDYSQLGYLLWIEHMWGTWSIYDLKVPLINNIKFSFVSWKEKYGAFSSLFIWILQIFVTKFHLNIILSQKSILDKFSALVPFLLQFINWWFVQVGKTQKNGAFLRGARGEKLFLHLAGSYHSFLQRRQPFIFRITNIRSPTFFSLSALAFLKVITTKY